jgi:ribosomal-protein-serine acetyltransferase
MPHPAGSERVVEADGAVAIRPFAVTDVEAVYEAVRASMDALSAWMPWCHASYAADDARAFLHYAEDVRAAGREYHFATIAERDGRLLGGCGLGAVDGINRTASLGYWVRSDAAGRGVATVAARLVAQFAFDELALALIEIRASVRNLASQRVAEKLGARRDAVLPGRLLLGTERHDAVVYSLRPDELRTDD